jgi:hypothetical protein
MPSNLTAEATACARASPRAGTIEGTVADSACGRNLSRTPSPSASTPTAAWEPFPDSSVAGPGRPPVGTGSTGSVEPAKGLRTGPSSNPARVTPAHASRPEADRLIQLAYTTARKMLTDKDLLRKGPIDTFVPRSLEWYVLPTGDVKGL